MIKELILLTSTLICLAACSTLKHNTPNVCDTRGVKYQEGYIYLTEGKAIPQIYLIHNKYNLPILVDHPVINPSASAGWASKINPDHWSAFMTTRRHFKMNCTVVYPSYKFKKINCANVVKIWQIRKFKAPRKFLDGSFWLAENKNHRSLLQRIKQIGVLINHTRGE